jgi:hypothetical protein
MDSHRWIVVELGESAGTVSDSSGTRYVWRGRRDFSESRESKSLVRSRGEADRHSQAASPALLHNGRPSCERNSDTTTIARNRNRRHYRVMCFHHR